MTDLRKAAEMALEVLEELQFINASFLKCEKAAEALRQALAQPEQEPVAHLWECIGRWTAMVAHDGEDANLSPPDWLVNAINAATAPPKREWQWLTGDEQDTIERMANDSIDAICLTQAKLKEKNT